MEYINLDLGRDTITKKLEPGQIDVECPRNPVGAKSGRAGWKAEYLDQDK